MTSARTEILQRIRTALADRPVSPPATWRYGRAVPVEELVSQFVTRAGDYRAVVQRVSAAAVPDAIDAALGASGPVIADRVLRERWAPALQRNWVQDADLSAGALDAIDAVVTTATVAIANTGTVILDHGPGQGRRAVTLVPDLHVCVVDAHQIVGDVPEAITRLIESGCQTRPLTWISGPSATSDIELSRVEGVHGPRRLHIIVADDMVADDPTR